MNPDPGSLDNLRDIVELPAVSWWPLAPGWWAVLFVVALVAVVGSVRAWKRWKANAYRRAALEALRSVTSLAEVAGILKRTALSAYPRTQVASLAGQDWIQWLAETGSAGVPQNVADSLARDVFAGGSSSQLSDTVAFAERWIRQHKSLEQARAAGSEL